MRKIYTLIVAVIITSSSYAQYYYLPHSLGQNPGNLNNDDEYPVGAGIPSGWTVALNGSASPVWSNVRTIPFSFDFNGTSYTNFIVSNSGVLTFATAAVGSTVPGFTNEAIPSTSIPDSSIVVWGIEGTNTTYSRVVTKTFGSAPNRQHWITFSAFFKGTTYTFWSIVLEETSNNIYIVDQRNGGTISNLTIGIQINDSTAYGVNNGTSTVSSQAGTDASPGDNHYYQFISGIQPQYDAAITSCSVPEFLAIGDAPFDITGSISNYGTDTITSYIIHYNINGDTTVSDTIEPVSIATYKNGNFSHPVQWTPNAIGGYTIKIWATDINGTNADLNNSNDTLIKNVFVASNLAQRKVLYEQFTSSTCGPCALTDPQTSAFLNSNGSNTSGGKIVAVKYHMNYPSPGTDPAYTTESNYRHDTFYGVNSVPRAIVGGNVYNESPAGLTQPVIDAQYNRSSIFEIDIDVAESTDSTVSISGSYTAYADLPAGLKLHVIVVEDLIDKSKHPLYKGTTSQQVFKYVMRKMLPNSNGTAMPALTANQNESFSFTHTFATNKVFSGMNNLTVVAFIQDNSTKEVHQAASKKITRNHSAYDIGLTKCTVADTLDLVNAPFSITGIVTNYGSEDVTNFTCNYNIDGVAPITGNIYKVVPGMHKISYSHPTKWTPASTGNYTIKVWSGTINSGNSDMNNSNDTITKEVYVKSTVGIKEETSFGKLFIYPNPFSDYTNITMELKESNNLTISLYNSMGQLIYNENKGILSQGEHSIRLSRKDLSSGIYFVHLMVGDQVLVRKVAIQE